MRTFTLPLLLALTLAAGPALAAETRKPCEELKSEIAAKLDAKGVTGYTLTIVKPEEVNDAKVVGSCDGGTMRIIYTRQ
jgi:hypothetical protein